MPSHMRSSAARRESVLDPDFTRRLEEVLRRADGERRRHALYTRIQSAIPLVLLAAPIIAWSLMASSPESAHVAIGALAWVAFVLDVGVHVDAGLLSYLHLQALPSLVGLLLFALVTAWLLSAPRGQE